MPTIDELVENAEAYAERFDRGDLPLPPANGLPSSLAWTRD
jgi:hypothetical protein